MFAGQDDGCNAPRPNGEGNSVSRLHRSYDSRTRRVKRRLAETDRNSQLTTCQVSAYPAQGQAVTLVEGSDRKLASSTSMPTANDVDCVRRKRSRVVRTARGQIYGRSRALVAAVKEQTLRGGEDDGRRTESSSSSPWSSRASRVWALPRQTPRSPLALLQALSA